MEKGVIKRYGILIITLVVVILVLLTQVPGKSFRPGAENIALPALAGSNTISYDYLMSIEKGTLLVSSGSFAAETGSKLDVMIFDRDELCTAKFLRSLGRSSSPLVIADEDQTLEAKVWMILSQMGVEKLFIYQEDDSEMSLKHEFRPDTIVSE